jgi:tetratricopeptide (TPR) repeat protein
MAGARYEQAGERYRTARDLDPTDNESLVGGALASIELRSQAAVRGLELTEARRDLEQALKVDPNQVDALVGLARINLYEGKAVEAKKRIEQALAIDDKKAVAHYWRGRILEDPAFSSVDADKAYARAIELAPKDFAAYVALSGLYAARAVDANHAGRKDEAKQWAERSVATLAPVAEAAKSDAKLADTLGNAYMGARDTAHAIEWFRVAVASAPDSPDTHAYLGQALLESGDVPGALTELQKAHDIAPRREDITLHLATALEKNHDFGGAEKLYSQLLSTDSGNVPTITSRAAAGRFYARRDLVSLAQQQGQLIAGTEPQNPTGHFLVGYGFLAAGRYPEAQKELRDAVAVDPQAQYLEALGRCYEQQKTFTDAEIAFDQAARLDPSYAAPILGLARIHLARREFSAAVAELEKAQALTPDDMEIWEGLGDAHLELRELDLSARAYEKALGHDDKKPELWFKLGKVYFQSDTGDVVGRLRGAIERAPAGTTWVPEAYRMLGFYYRARNDVNDMCAAFERYLALAPPTDLMYTEVKRSHAGCP